MIIDHRTYSVIPGKLPEFLKVYQELGLETQKKHLGGLVALIKDNTISGKIAKEVFDDMFETGKDPKVIVEEKGLKQITDTWAIEAIIDEIIANSTNQVEQYRSGKTGLIGWFVGQVMKQTQGKANPGAVNQILKAKLDG